MKNNARGVGLMEMLIAMLLTVILLGAAFGFFDGMESMSEEVSVMSEANNSLRGSADLITRDIYAAGTAIPAGGIPIPTGPGSVQVKRPGPGSTYFPATNGVLSVITPGPGLSGTIGGIPSDEITVIMVDENWTGQPALQISSITDSVSNGYTVNVTVPPSCTQNCTMAAGGAYNVNVGDLLMFTASGGSALGLVTSVDTTNNIVYFAADPLNLDQVCAAQGCAGSIDALEPDPVNRPGVYPPGMTLTKIDMVTYYIDNSNPAHPYTLQRELAADTPNAVAYGINNLQVTYDLSTGGAGNTNLPNPANPNQIRKVNLWLSAISPHPLRKSHRYYSNSLASAVTLRNLEYVNQF
ncbi:MAG: PilW family protein [Terriglobia bacterium]